MIRIIAAVPAPDAKEHEWAANDRSGVLAARPGRREVEYSVMRAGRHLGPKADCVRQTRRDREGSKALRQSTGAFGAQTRLSR